jgi:hypothetical protein
MVDPVSADGGGKGCDEERGFVVVSAASVMIIGPM